MCASPFLLQTLAVVAGSHSLTEYRDLARFRRFADRPSLLLLLMSKAHAARLHSPRRRCDTTRPRARLLPGPLEIRTRGSLTGLRDTVRARTDTSVDRRDPGRTVSPTPCPGAGPPRAHTAQHHQHHSARSPPARPAARRPRGKQGAWPQATGAEREEGGQSGTGGGRLSGQDTARTGGGPPVQVVISRVSHLGSGSAGGRLKLQGGTQADRRQKRRRREWRRRKRSGRAVSRASVRRL